MNTVEMIQHSWQNIYNCTWKNILKLDFLCLSSLFLSLHSVGPTSSRAFSGNTNSYSIKLIKTFHFSLMNYFKKSTALNYFLNSCKFRKKINFLQMTKVIIYFFIIIIIIILSTLSIYCCSSPITNCNKSRENHTPHLSRK